MNGHDQHNLSEWRDSRPPISGAAIVGLTIVYFVAALAFGAFMEMQKPVPSLPAAVIGRTVGNAITVFVGSAIIPAIVWAFFRFSLQKLRGPLVLWACLGIIFCSLIYAGKEADLRNLEGITTSDGRAEFVRGALNSCATDRLKNRQYGIMSRESYCRCFGESVAQVATPEELSYFSERGDPQPSLLDKIKQARDKCIAAETQLSVIPKNP